MSTLNYYISCEGETEKWYFEWLQNQINQDPRVKNKVKLHPKKGRSPTAFAKSNQGAFTPCKYFYLVRDIEDYEKLHLDQLHSACDNLKKASQIMRRCQFSIAYSNLTFEVWMIAHRKNVPVVTDRRTYYQEINKAFHENFIDNADYKKEKNFHKLLNSLTLNDVIDRALPECKRIRENNELNHIADRKEYKGLVYYLINPDSNVDQLVRKVLQDAGIM